MPRRQIGPEERRELRELRAAGQELAPLARRFGVSTAAVWCHVSDPETAARWRAVRDGRLRSAAARRARAAGRARAKRAAGRADRDREIRELRAAGWSVRALADRFALAVGTVSRIAPTGRPAAERLDDPPAAPPPAAIPAVGPDPTPAGQLPAAESIPPDADGPARHGYGYYAPAIGSDHGRAVLDEERVAEMRRLRRDDPKRWTYPALAERYGVHRQTVFHILSGRTWRHVPA
jgi:hypothetical protein